MIETTIRLKPRAEWPRLYPRALVFELGGAALEARARLALAREGAARRPPSWSSGSIAPPASPGWTNAWTAPIRARLDMMSTGRAHAGRGPHRHRRSGPARRARRGGARGRAEGAGHEERGVRGAGRRDAAGVRARRGGDRAPQGRPGLVRATAICSSAAGGSGRCACRRRRSTRRCCCRRRSTPPMRARARARTRQRSSESGRRHPHADRRTGSGGRPAADRRRCPSHLARGALAPEAARAAAARRDGARRRRATGSRCRSRCSAGRRSCRRPRSSAPNTASRSGTSTSTSSEDTDIATLRRAARAAMVDGALAAGEPQLRPGERIEWTGQYELMIAGQRPP